MKNTLFNSKGEPVAYISRDQNKTIYTWNGYPVAYLNGYNVYGFNGLHLGWLINDIIYDFNGDRIGFSSSTCPVSVFEEPPKTKAFPVDKIRPRYEAPPLPNLGFNISTEDFEEFLRKGGIEPGFNA